MLNLHASVLAMLWRVVAILVVVAWLPSASSQSIASAQEIADDVLVAPATGIHNSTDLTGVLRSSDLNRFEISVAEPFDVDLRRREDSRVG